MTDLLHLILSIYAAITLLDVMLIACGIALFPTWRDPMIFIILVPLIGLAGILLCYISGITSRELATVFLSLLLAPLAWLSFEREIEVARKRAITPR